VNRGASARPLHVSVLQLLRQPGTRRELRTEAVLGDLRVGDAEVPADAAVALDVVLEAIGDSITVVGEITAPYTASCRRCLEPIEAELVTDVQEIFERRPVEGETYLLAGEELDLEPMARDAVLLALPLAPLCRDDCPGPVPGALLDEDDEPDEAPPPDPRWAALRNLELS
jgi:uncharacterized protein